MSSFLATISSQYGLVVIADSDSDPNRTTAVHTINDHCVAMVFRGDEGAKEFIEKHLIPLKRLSINEFIEKADTIFKKHHTEYSKHNFSIILAWYNDRDPIYYGLWFENNGEARTGKQPKTSLFIQDVEDLANYLVSKVYSNTMSLEELKNLAAFITLQCSKIFGYGFNFKIITMSDGGIKTLSEGDIRDLLQKQEKADNKLKKIFADFFTCEVKS